MPRKSAIHNALLVMGLGMFISIPAKLAGQDAAPPDGWLVRTDAGGHGAAGEDLVFSDMPPGWHITTGPAAILYHPDRTASGDFRVDAEIFLFDPSRRNEGYGIFIGGSDLDGDGQAYTYFLLRRDGSFLVKRRDGAGTSNVQGWTPHEAIVTWEARGDGEATAENDLAIEANADHLVFFVNGQEVFRTARGDAHVDGVVGLRVNHSLNLHVASLDVTPIG